MSDQLTLGQTTELLTLDSLAAVARGKPYEMTTWATTACLSLAGELIETTLTLTDAGRAKLDAAMAKLSDEHRAAFLAEGLKAKVFQEPTP